MKKTRNILIACLCIGIIVAPFIADTDQIIYITHALLGLEEKPIDHVSQETHELEEKFQTINTSGEELIDTYNNLTESYMSKSKKSEFGQQCLTIEKWFKKGAQIQNMTLPNSSIKGQPLTYTVNNWYITEDYDALPSVNEGNYPPAYMENYMLNETTLKEGFTWLCTEVTVRNDSDRDFNYYTIPTSYVIMNETGNIYWYVGDADIYSSNQPGEDRKAYFYEFPAHSEFTTTYCAICPKIALDAYTPYLIVNTSSAYPYDLSTGGLLQLK